MVKRYLGDIKVRTESLDNPSMCLVGEMIISMQHKRKVKNSWLLDTINAILDFIHTIHVDFPEHHRKRLYKLADHLTFNLQYEKIFDEPGYSREELLESLYWSIGLVFSHSKVK
ncbi:hypothetical protein [Xanthocytophaga agilis]|uniref:Uncharacterized protein n=1 Tax=Xanthocytophaga agilis TaxID=3048010 RepID=A0AAE3UDT5_9BACT|nr:hypothetical protein [Xanthocytophaga agilis]MDJ1502213.1 hypothetical protein [Xanthocytophaga agilis]